MDVILYKKLIEYAEQSSYLNMYKHPLATFNSRSVKMSSGEIYGFAFRNGSIGIPSHKRGLSGGNSLRREVMVSKWVQREDLEPSWNEARKLAPTKSLTSPR